MSYANALRRFAPACVLAAACIAFATVTRLVLAAHAGMVISLGDWLSILGRGLLFDVTAALYFCAPFVVWLTLAPNRVAAWRLYRLATLLGLAALAYALILVAVAEWLFWDEFGGRFNFIAVDYLVYSQEVWGNIRESYPVGRILAILLLPAGGVALLGARLTWRTTGAPLNWRTRFVVIAVYALAVAGTLRFLDCDFRDWSGRDAANELAGNGIYQFFAANRRNELNYERNYATLPIVEAIQTVRTALDVRADAWTSPPEEGIERAVAANGDLRKLNIVLVSIESLGAEFLGAYGDYGDPRGLTPNLDRLAQQSLWFSNVYATGNRTVRGLEALSLAQPPTPGQSIVRRPKNNNLFSLGSILEDKNYGVLFAYGGYGYFDNMNAFFDANDYRSIDRSDIPSERVQFENIWGVADEHLYDQVLTELDRETAAHPGKPVFAHVMTTSNHRPYTYPPGRIDIPSGTGREGAVKYTDYAIGRFLEQAQGHAWFKNTIFVITADHGADARGTSKIPVDKYRIPLFVYSPGNVTPRKVDRLMSQIDIAPTMLGLLNLPYYSKFIGRDVLHAPASTDRAFVANYQTVGYIKGDRMVLLRPKRVTEVLRLGTDMKPLGNVSDPALTREAIAFYQFASYAFSHGLLVDEEQVSPENRRNPGSGKAPDAAQKTP